MVAKLQQSMCRHAVLDIGCDILLSARLLDPRSSMTGDLTSLVKCLQIILNATLRFLQLAVHSERD